MPKKKSKEVEPQDAPETESVSVKYSTEYFKDKSYHFLMYGKRILIEREELKSESGLLYIPDTKEKFVLRYGKVVGTGPDVERASIGDKVCYGTYSGGEFEYKDKHFVINEEDIIMQVIDR